MYRVLLANAATAPLAAIPEALAIVRLHSCYPWHRGGAYRQFHAPGDDALLAAVNDFNQFDLYSKSNERPDAAALWPYCACRRAAVVGAARWRRLLASPLYSALCCPSCLPPRQTKASSTSTCRASCSGRLGGPGVFASDESAPLCPVLPANCWSALLPLGWSTGSGSHATIGQRQYCRLGLCRNMAMHWQ